MTRSLQIRYILRIAVAMCFIGHGAFGIITKPIWCNYFAVVGIGHDLAYQLMPVVGTIDITLGIIMLAYPVPAIPLWLVCWGFITALLRPLSGEPFAELIERAGNFGAPLGLLILTGFPKNSPLFPGQLFTLPDPMASPDKQALARLTTCLKIIVFLLLLGHGWLNLIEKKGLITQYTALGFANPEQVAKIAGIGEIIAAVAILIKPVRVFVFILFFWKVGTELLYPSYGVIEWIERGGSYGCLLALGLLAEKKPVVRAVSRLSYAN